MWRFTEHGVPCRRLCAATLGIKLHTLMLVIPELQVEELRATYDGVVMAVDLNELVDDGLAPPIETKRHGRPKQNGSNHRPRRNRKELSHVDAVGKLDITQELAKPGSIECFAIKTRGFNAVRKRRSLRTGPGGPDTFSLEGPVGGQMFTLAKCRQPERQVRCQWGM